MNIRNIEPEDCKAILEVASDWWGSNYSSDMFSKWYIQHFRDTCLLAEENGKIIGFVMGFLSQSESVVILLSTLYELEIIPGKRIGKYQIGWRLDELMKHIDFEYTIKHYPNETIAITSDDFWFTLNETEGLYNIYSMGNYQGKYKNLIGLGSILTDIKGSLNYELDEAFLEDTMWWRFKPRDEQGIHFVPEKEWDDRTPITSIHVFLV
ncbi:MAG: hypothetical protein ACQEXQ_29140 [Bacillota bacterium]